MRREVQSRAGKGELSNVEIAVALIGLGGVAVGAALTWWAQRVETRRVSRRHRVLRLYQEWQSPEMLVARVTANSTIAGQSAGFSSAADLRKRLVAASPEWNAVLVIVHFLQACNALSSVKATDKALFDSLFALYVDYWKRRCLELLHPIDEEAKASRDSSWGEVVAEVSRIALVTPAPVAKQ
jgi:hypothetical protein